MIISDLNYLEVVEQGNIVGGYSFNKNVSSTVSSTFNFNSNIDIKKNKNVDVNINADANVKNNIAELTFDAEAIGPNTLVEVEASVLATTDLSSVAASIIAVSA